MIQKVSTTTIGGFIIAATILLVTAVVLLGGGTFWKQTELYVLQFDESVKGLTVGSAVMFRGVQIGTVKSIKLQTDHEQSTVNIPIIIEINHDRFYYGDKPREDFKQYFAGLIASGLRAQLALQSIVTAQLMIQLDSHPDTELRLSNIDSKLVEIPTIRSPLSEFGLALEGLPIKEITNNILELSHQINQILKEGEIHNILANISSAADNTSTLIKNTNKLVINADDKIDIFSQELGKGFEDTTKFLNEAMKSITTATDNINKVLTSINSEIIPIAAKLDLTLDSATTALEQTGATMQVAEILIERSDTRIKLNHALDEISAAARSMKELTDYLEQHPEALLMGRNGDEN
jgi:paraquat-inducible protein B